MTDTKVPRMERRHVCVSPQTARLHQTRYTKAAELLRETRASFMCKADVFVSLGSSACQRSWCLGWMMKPEPRRRNLLKMVLIVMEDAPFTISPKWD